MKSLQVGFSILAYAYRRFIRDNGWAIASHVALSILLALFPFLIFGTALASYLGVFDFSQTAIQVMFEAWPRHVAEPIIFELQNVLQTQRPDLLTLGGIAALFFASNGVEALRVALNRAYRVEDNRSWILIRLQSLLFVIVGTVVLAMISSVLVLLPLVKSLATKYLPWVSPYLEIGFYGPQLLTLFVLTLGLLVSHKWLPAGKRSFVSMIPGIAFTIIFWISASFGFAYYLEGFANYVSTYAGLAGIMIALIFLYLTAAIFILGAELNAAASKHRAAGEGNHVS